MHTDRNHSWLPTRSEPPWWHVESFLYLSDVDDGSRRRISSRSRTPPGRSPNVPLIWPPNDPEISAAERYPKLDLAPWRAALNRAP